MANVQNVTVSQRRVKGSTSVLPNDSYRPLRTFEPFISDSIQVLNDLLLKDFPLLTHCIWTTEWLNTWMIHQSVHTYTIIEVEESACESVFYHFRASGFKNVFLEPDALLMERYVSDAENPIIIQKLLLRSPLLSVKVGNGRTVKVPKLEKILVDVYCDDILFFAYRGNEQEQLFQRVFNNYALDMKTLFAYAERRKRKVSLMQYLHSNKIMPL